MKNNKDFVKGSIAAHGYKHWSAHYGRTLWIFVIAAGTIGTFLWSWLAFPIAFVATSAWGAFASYRMSKAIEKETGLTFSEQKFAWETPLAIDDIWLWDHAGDFALGLHHVLKKALLEKKTENKTLTAEITQECGYVAGEMTNIVVFAMGKEIVGATVDERIAREVEAYRIKTTDLRTHLSKRQIERAELYGIAYYMTARGKSAEEISKRTRRDLDEVHRMMRDPRWLVAE